MGGLDPMGALRFNFLELWLKRSLSDGCCCERKLLRDAPVCISRRRLLQSTAEASTLRWQESVLLQPTSEQGSILLWPAATKENGAFILCRCSPGSRLAGWPSASSRPSSLHRRFLGCGRLCRRRRDRNREFAVAVAATLAASTFPQGSPSIDRPQDANSRSATDTQGAFSP